VWYPSRKGEDLAALHDRLAGFLAVFVPEVHRRFAGKHKRILLVSHAATAIALAHELVGDRSMSFRAACCSITVLDRKVVAAAASDHAEGNPTPFAVVGGWTARSLGDASHLMGGPKRAWGFEDVVVAANGEVRNFLSESGTESLTLV
jgi:transcription factor C subunit 7